ncbi:MAG: thioredoxin domain-containing protein [Spirochaetes bacterium]|nr:thioredoxin domain-containing protein [Spirochaetota bacterium]
MTQENRLAGQKSPYLRQHLHNPVEWYPWGEEAFALARETDRPIFLSIGYSTCHWCHVMERESFEDGEVARALNVSFVAVKVDREERPDVDRVYMAVCQMLTGRGGWPLTILMTPSRRPFFAATYLPRESAGGRVGLLELLDRAAAAWREKRDEVEESAAAVAAALNRPAAGGDAVSLPGDLPDRAFRELSDRYDPLHGGFGTAPKFPSAHNLVFLLRYWHVTGNERARDMALETLAAMRRGGIFDHLGHGFHRYSTDGRWLLPHFEKMLYDQAMIAMASCEAYQAGGGETHAATARDTYEYVLRDMTAPRGFFYSAEDADSDGREGRFYLWSAGELREVLGADDAVYAEEIFGVRGEGNVHDEATGILTGENVLHLGGAPPADGRFESVRRRLLEARGRRPRPFRDEKILADWNGLMVASLAIGARILGDDRYRAAAERAAEALWKELVREDRLSHAWIDGEASIDGYCDDYAFMAWGLLELYGATFDTRHLDRAMRLAGMMIRLFSREGGGFGFSPADGEAHITDFTDYHDGAYPSGNGVAAWVLTRLARLTGDPSWEARAGEILRGAGPGLARHPSAHAMLCATMLHQRDGASEVVVAGNEDDPVFREMTGFLRRSYLPHCAVLVKTPRCEGPSLGDLATFTAMMSPSGGRVTAWVCRGKSCAAPVHAVDELAGLLGKST